MIISKRFSNPRVFRISQWSRAMRRIIFLGSALWSSSSFAQTSITPTTLSFAKQATNESSSANADAVWKKASADEGLRQAFERTTYSLEDSGHGTYRGV